MEEKELHSAAFALTAERLRSYAALPQTAIYRDAASFSSDALADHESARSRKDTEMLHSETSEQKIEPLRPRVLRLSRDSTFAVRILQEVEHKAKDREEEHRDFQIVHYVEQVAKWAGRRSITHCSFGMICEFVATVYPWRRLTEASAIRRVRHLKQVGLIHWVCGRGKKLADVTVTFPGIIDEYGGEWLYLQYLDGHRARSAARQRKHYRLKKEDVAFRDRMRADGKAEIVEDEPAPRSSENDRGSAPSP